MIRICSFTLFLALAGGGTAAEYGPFCQWYRDPCTTMAIQWVETTSREGTEGKWMTGPAGFGYGDNDDQTVFDDMKGKFRSVYIRRAFEVPKEAPVDAELVLAIRYDDGFVAYLDGEEVVRKGVQGSGNTVQDVTSHEADVWEKFSLGKVKPGARGIVAIEGHNAELDSSDFTLRPRLDLTANGDTMPVIAEGAEWAYLAGGIPEAGWTATIGEPAEGPGRSVALYEIGYRVAKSGGEWVRGEVTSRNLGPTSHVVHSADLDGLQPGTRYEFRIARRGEAMGTWEFLTAPGEFEDGLAFVTGGDMFHTRAKLDAMNTRAGKEDPLFALLGGDLAYANGVSGERWLEWVESWHECAVAPDGRLIPMIVVIGNHEVKGVGFKPTNAPGRDEAPYFYSLFLGQEEGGHTVVDFGDYLSIVGLDSGHTENVARQTQWLDYNLEKRAGVPRLFVCYHRPAWGTGVKGDAIDIQDEWCPLFVKNKVDAVFENDHHVYKRTHPIVGKGTVDDENGVLYLGDGSWGVNTRIIPNDWKQRRPWLAEAQAVNHLIKVTMTREGFEYDAIKADGEIFDEVDRPLRR